MRQEPGFDDSPPGADATPEAQPEATPDQQDARAQRTRRLRRIAWIGAGVAASLAVAVGIWIAVLEVPVWIAYPMVFAPALNAIINRGLPGLGLSLAWSCGGILAGVLLHGYRYWPDTSPLITTLCFLGSLSYSAGVG